MKKILGKSSVSTRKANRPRRWRFGLDASPYHGPQNITPRSPPGTRTMDGESRTIRVIRVLRGELSVHRVIKRASARRNPRRRSTAEYADHAEQMTVFRGRCSLRRFGPGGVAPGPSRL